VLLQLFKQANSELLTSSILQTPTQKRGCQQGKGPTGV
jgi:hypothetical protein